MNKKIALVVIYNHQFNKNIEIINQIYKDRFDAIYHLVPFYKGDLTNVIPVYENSFRFQGYIAQSWKQLSVSGCDSFVVIGDDLLLAPVLNGQNIHEKLGLDPYDAFIPAACFNYLVDGGWSHSRKALEFLKHAKGSEGIEYLPSVAQAHDLISQHGLNYQPYMPSIAIPDSPSGDFYPMPYPLVFAYSDFFIVPLHNLELLAHYCGIFSSMNLFVEIALPTALAFSATKLRTHTLNYSSGAMWNIEEIEELRVKHKGSLSSLFQNFPEKKIYLHPIKLSKWTN